MQRYKKYTQKKQNNLVNILRFDLKFKKKWHKQFGQQSGKKT